MDAENKVDFEASLGFLCDIWEYRLRREGWELCNWFLKYKEHKMKKKSMAKYMRAASFMGSLPKQFLTS